MASRPPILDYDELRSTRDYLREVALVLSSLQRGFLPKQSHDWQYGLEVTMRGLSTQAFTVQGETLRPGLDLVRHKLRLAGEKWGLHECAAPEMLVDIEAWLQARGAPSKLDQPKFMSGVMLYDTAQAELYAEALWWLEAQFRQFKAGLDEGVTSPILLYPHHFDLSLVWFPFNDARQLSLGWSTGDETIPEPYVYLTASPEPAGFTQLELPAGAYWQAEGFSGAILPYAVLAAAAEPAELLQRFAGTLAAARKLR